jgi:hypothetical protein
MSNYTVTTNFGAKDGLNSGNPAKLILGGQHTTEYNNIAIAINSKLDALTIDGSAATPSVSFANNPTTGLFNSAGALGITTGGVARASVAANGQLTVTDPIGSVWGAPTGGAKGANTINVSGGLFVNGAAVSTAISTLYKASTTTRTSNSFIADPDLSFNAVAGHTYAVRILALVNGVAANGGLVMGVGGTATTTQSNTMATSRLSGSFLSPGVQPSFGTFSISNAGAVDVGNADYVLLEGTYTVSVSGTIALVWGQSSSSANGTSVTQASYMSVTQLA